MRVLVADKLEREGVEGLRGIGCEVVLEPDLDAGTLPEGAARVAPEVLVVRSTRVTGEALRAAAGLRLIIRAGSGYDNIDVDGATERGIAVCNCPGMNAVAVAELTIGHLVACDRLIPDQTADLRAGRWDKQRYSVARGLKGRTLGVIGYGSIARAVVRRAAAFGMPMLIWSRSAPPEEVARFGGEVIGSDREALLELARRSDAVTVHLALCDETRGLIDAEFFDAMRPGASFINTSRGGIADEGAMVRAALAKRLRLGLDVYHGVPEYKHGAWQTPAASVPGASLTHHIGASTEQAQTAVADEVVRIVRVFQETGRAENRVNEPAPA